MATFACPYLGGEVQLTEEREKHIADNHPDLLPENRTRSLAHWRTQMRSGGALVSPVHECFQNGMMTYVAVSLL
jgi:hypothetical protein